MERSKHGLLVIIFVGVVGIFLTLGIILYSRVQTSPDLDTPVELSTVSDERVFSVKKEDLRRLELEINGRSQLQIDWDEKAKSWQLDNRTPLPIDQSKLNNYIDNILLYRFVGQVNDADRNLQEYGLDYPTYVLTLEDQFGAQQKLWIGGRVSGSFATYAVSSQAEEKLRIVPNPTATILAEVRDFFLDNIFSIDGEHIRRLRIRIPQRSFNLLFAKNSASNEWTLIEPTSWPVFKGEFEAYLRNLIFFSAVRYYTDDELRHIQFESDNVVAHITLESDVDEEQISVYSDRFGNFYGKTANHPYYILLPASFQTVVYKPLNLMLEAFPNLPAFSDLETMSCSSENGIETYRRIGDYWLSDQGILTRTEQERLEVWYNSLRQNTILSTSMEDEFSSDARTFIINTYAKGGVFTQVKWQMLTDETAVVWQDGQNMHFVVRAPQPFTIN